jgi:hypothetical protein
MRLAPAAVWACAILAMPPALAETLDYPTSGVVRSTKTNDALYIECEPPLGTALACRFAALVVTKKDLSELRPFQRKECEMLDGFARAYRDGEPPPGVDAEAFRDRFAYRAPEQQAEINALVEAFGAFCKSGSADDEGQLLDVMRRKESRTCTLSINTYELRFSWDGATRRWVSESEESSEPCGAMRIATFERPPASRGNAPWSYRITDHAGKPGENAACPQPEASTVLYAPDPEEIYVACDYMRVTD